MKLLIALLFSTLLLGQTTPFSLPLNKISGMPSDVVFDVFQDKKGFTWFATANGICKFDGLQLKVLDSPDFPVKSVSNIAQDSFGRIWFQSFTGGIFYIENEKIHQFQPYKANGFLKFGLIKNQLFIIGKQGVKIFDLKNFHLKKTIPLDLKLVLQSVTANQKFYIVGDQVQYLDENGNQNQVRLPEDYTQKILAPIPIAGKNGIYIFSKFNENYLEIDNRGVRYQKFPFKTVFTQNANVIDDDLWVCSTKGIYRYHLPNKTFQQYFPNINISFITKTKAGKFWISTFNYGALFVDNFNSNIIETPSTPTILAKDNGNLFFGTNREEIFKLDAHQKIESVVKGDSDHNITSIFMDKFNNRILFSGSKFTIKTKDRIFQNILAVKNIVQLDRKYYAVAASNWNGIVFLDPNQKSELDAEFSTFKSYLENGIHFIPLITAENGKDVVYNSQENSLYFLTNYGLKKFRNGQITEIPSNPNSTFTQIGFLNHQLFVLSENEKLSVLHSNKIAAFRFPNQFENQKILKIKFGEDRLFLFKENEIFEYIPAKSTVKKIIDIPQELEILDLVEQGNTLVFATNKGIIKTARISNETNIPMQLFVNSVSVNGKAMDALHLKKLTSTENNIQINFDLLSETPHNHFSIQYRIDKNQWETLPNTSRNLKFPSLSYGNHRIQLKIINGNQTLIKEINPMIAAPFYLKWWSILAMSVLVIFLVYLYFKRKISHINERNRKELEQANLEKLANQNKLRSLKSQMNPHFFFNALNTLQSYIVTNEKKEAVSYLSRFSKLTRSILEMSDRDDISIPEEVQTLKNYLELEKTRFNGDFNFEIQVDSSIDNSESTIPTLLLQPYVENAIKHGLLHKKGDKILKILFEDQENTIKIRVDDNGIGRKLSTELNEIKNKDHKSFATQSLEERVHLLNIGSKEKIRIEYIDKENAKGTTVIFVIPKIPTNTI